MKPLALITGGGGALATALRSLLAADEWTVHSPGHDDMDVTDPARIRDYFAALPRLDLLINNAAIRRDALLADQPEAERNAVIDTTLGGAWLCSRAAIPIMSAQGSGHIIHIGSHSARGVAGQTAYAAAKAGLEGLTRSMAATCGPANIRINTVLPGWLETPFTATVPPHAAARALAAHHLGRFNTVHDAARFIIFLHSMSAVSGQIFQLDSRSEA